MLSFSDIEDIVKDFDSPPFKMRLTENIHGQAFLQATMWRRNVNTGEMEWGRGGKSYISPYSARNEIIQRCLGACLAFVEHEVRENTTYKGRHIFNPHIDTDALWNVCETKEYRQ